MIYVRLAGGLGNQLFQLIAAILVSKQTGLKVVPIMDALSRYAQQRSADSLRLLSSPLMLSPEVTRPTAALCWLITTGRIGRWLPTIGLNDGNFQDWPDLLRSSHLCVVDGYFQKGWTVTRFEEVMQKCIFPPPSAAARERIKADECLIHIRGGDFLSHISHQVVNADYYVTAVQQAKAIGWSKFVVMTDDLEYAQLLTTIIADRLPDVQFHIMPPSPDPLEDIGTLQLASARIIGNSTFAWWGTALDKRRAITWSPSKFLRDSERDFYLSWEQRIAV